MGLRDRIQSALMGVPASTDTRPGRREDNPYSSRARSGPSRGSYTSSRANAGGRVAQPAIEGRSNSSPVSRARPRQLAIQRSSAPTSTTSLRQSSSTNAATSPTSHRTLPTPSVSTPALPLARVSRPYGSTGNQEAFVLDPSRKIIKGDASGTPNRSSTSTSRVETLTNSTATSSRREDGEVDDLLPLNEREIVDVTDEHHILPIEVHNRGRVRGGAQQTQARQISRTPTAASRAQVPQRTRPLTRMPPAGRFSNRSAGQTTTGPPRGGASQGGSQPRAGYQPLNRSQYGSTRPASTTQASGDVLEQPQGLYLGVFDLDETDQSAQQTTSTNRGRPSQRGRRGGESTFSQRSMSNRTSTSTRHTTVINHGYPAVPVYRRRFGSFNGCPYGAYGYPDDLYPDWPHPWFSRPYVVLPCQTIFTEVSTDYFDQETTEAPQLDIHTGLEVINRYYNGWRDAYTQALAGTGAESMSAADRARIETNRQRLQGMQDEAIRRLRDEDNDVVQETLDRVKLDRQMAVDMPASQIRWATPWIREVWVREHGDIPR